MIVIPGLEWWIWSWGPVREGEVRFYSLVTPKGLTCVNRGCMLRVVDRSQHKEGSEVADLHERCLIDGVLFFVDCTLSAHAGDAKLLWLSCQGRDDLVRRCLDWAMNVESEVDHRLELSKEVIPGGCVSGEDVDVEDAYLASGAAEAAPGLGAGTAGGEGED